MAGLRLFHYHRILVRENTVMRSGEIPTIKWYYKILENDTHDSDPAMIPVLFDGQVGGQTRPLVAIGDKAGNFVLLDRKTGEVVHRLVLSKQVGLNIQQSPEGTEACPF